MKQLHITVKDKVAEYTNRDGVIVCGNSDYQVVFAFDPSWDGLDKTARFVWGGKFYDVPIGTDNTCLAPVLYGTTACYVGVYSPEKQTTTSARIPCQKSILCETDVPAPEYEEPWVLDAQKSAEAAAESASEAAASASAANQSEVNSATNEQLAAQHEAAARESAEAAQKVLDNIGATFDEIDEMLDTASGADIDLGACYYDATEASVVIVAKSGATKSIPLRTLKSTGTDANVFGLVKINAGGINGLALNSGYLVINPANVTELDAKKDTRKPVVSNNFAAGLNANLKAGEGIALSYDETAKEVTVSATGGTGGGAGSARYMHFVHGVLGGVSFSAVIVNDSASALTQLSLARDESLPVTAFIDGELYTKLIFQAVGSDEWDNKLLLYSADGKSLMAGPQIVGYIMDIPVTEISSVQISG